MDMLVCECCVQVVANGDDSACRDYWGHTHPTMAEPTAVIMEFEPTNIPYSWDCEGCGTTIDPLGDQFRVTTM